MNLELKARHFQHHYSSDTLQPLERCQVDKFCEHTLWIKLLYYNLITVALLEI